MPGDRDSACTPKWLVDALDFVYDYDPCSNPRSHVETSVKLSLEGGDDGLVEANGPGAYQIMGRFHYTVDESGLVFCNPPYSRDQVMRWVRHYQHTDYTFLLRWAPDTRWWKQLMSTTAWTWHANRRIEFEPPPGVEYSSNPYPHALYFKDTAAPYRHPKLGGLGTWLLTSPSRASGMISPPSAVRVAQPSVTTRSLTESTSTANPQWDGRVFTYSPSPSSHQVQLSLPWGSNILSATSSPSVH